MATPADMHACYVYALGRVGVLGAGATTTRIGPWQVTDAGIGDSFFNIAVAVEPVTDPEGSVEEVVDWYRRRDLSIYRFHLRSDTDEHVYEATRSRGIPELWREPAMLLDPLPPAAAPPPGLRVREVSDTDVAAYCRVDGEEYSDQAFQAAMAATARELPGCTLLLGCLGEEPVARSMAVQHGDIVGVHNVYVPPSRRRSGLGTALTMAAVEAGRRGGATAACLEATELGRPVYERLGFRWVYDYLTVGPHMGGES